MHLMNCFGNFGSANHRLGVDAGGAFCLHTQRHWPGTTQTGCWLSMRAASLISVLVLLCGCDPGAIKRVSMSLPAQTGTRSTQEADRVLVEHADARRALQIVDAVVKPHGLALGEGAKHEPQGIAYYGRPPVGNGPGLSCTVTLEEKNLVVAFVEFPKWRSSPEVIQMRNTIRSEFTNAFGKAKVH